MKKCLPPIYLDMKLNIRSDSFASQDNCTSNQKRSEIMPCKSCKGTGKVTSGRGAFCMEPVEKVEKCPNCSGKGYLQAWASKDIGSSDESFHKKELGL